MRDDSDLVREMEEMVDAIDNKYDSRIRKTINPKIEENSEGVSQNQQEIESLVETVGKLQQKVAVMEGRLEGIAGLADDQETNPQKRVADLREAMIRRAEARSDDPDEQRVSMWWEEVQDLFADYGHGEIKKPECYKAITDGAKAPGFSEGKKINEKGNNVKAILLDLEELRAHASSSDSTTLDPQADGKMTADELPSATSD